jgi:hypothetical protein
MGNCNSRKVGVLESPRNRRPKSHSPRFKERFSYNFGVTTMEIVPSKFDISFDETQHNVSNRKVKPVKAQPLTMTL